MPRTRSPLPLHGCEPDDDSTSERYTRALMRLTREVWHPDCSFDTAVGLICEVAARTLRVDRANVWRYDAPRHALHCTHSYLVREDRHLPPAALESVRLSPEYEAALHEVRAIDLCDIEPDTHTEPDGLNAYFRRHRIRALLDAPVCIEGEQLGVICHECIDAPRAWTREEKVFAGSMGDYVAMAHQIARRHEAQRELHHLRLHDPTTGLPNRDCMLEIVSQWLHAPHAVERVTAVVHLRLEAMHDLALTPGTPTHEDLMAQAAERLRELTGHRSRLARVRADGFAILAVGDGPAPDVLRLASHCVDAVRTLPRDGETPDPAAWAGVAFAEPDERDARVLLRKAEQAATHAHRLGRDRVCVFDLERHESLLARMRLERALRAGFEAGELELHYQPEYDLVERRWAGAEALLRWRHGGRLRPAAEFIEVAEASELILSIGDWALQHACDQAARWPCSGRARPVLRVNVSTRQFEQRSLVDTVAAALAASGLEPQRLCLEITETTLMRDAARSLQELRALRALGLQLAIDDFGTGYSSLAYLKQLPVGVLKLDRGFVQGLPHDRADAAIVRAVTTLAQSLQLDVVAEGVETPVQEAALVAAGVSRVQGWLYAQALEPARLCALFEAGGGAG